MARAGLTPSAVVQAAAELADAEGLDAVTLSSVAKRLGVKPPSLYAHIDGLADLRQRLAVRGANEIVEVLSPAVAGRARGDALRAVARAYREWAGAHPGLNAAAQFVLIPDEPASQRAIGLFFAVMNGYGLEGDAAIHAVRALRATVIGFVALEAGGGFGIPLDTDESFEWLLTLLDRGLSGQLT